MSQTLAELAKSIGTDIDEVRAARITAARQRLAELLDADTYDCATLHTAARDLLNALEA